MKRTTSTGAGHGNGASPGHGGSLLGKVLRGGVIALAAAALLVFLAGLSYLTMTPVPGAEDMTHPNLDPGSTLELYTDGGSVQAFVIQLGGNLALFMPLGVLLPVIFRSLRGPLRILLAAGLFSLIVETVQGTMVVGRAFDIDDAMLNTAGAVIAYLVVGRLLARWVHRPQRP